MEALKALLMGTLAQLNVLWITVFVYMQAIGNITVFYHIKWKFPSHFWTLIFFPILGTNELDCSLIMDSGDTVYTEFDFEDQVILCVYGLS